jgi:hypothetical protein
MSMSVSRILQYLLLLLLLLLGSFCAHALSLAPASAQNSIDIEFKDNGQTVKALPLDELQKRPLKSSLPFSRQ